MTLDHETQALADALEHDAGADYTHLPTTVVAEWLLLADEEGMLPPVHKAGKRGPDRKFARTTAQSCVWFRWALPTGEEGGHRITRAGRAALHRFRCIASRVPPVSECSLCSAGGIHAQPVV